jgi:uncharacterized integral membrane protein
MLTLCATILSLALTVTANDLANYFANPSDGSSLTWSAGTVQTVIWSTSVTDSYPIYLYQQTTQNGVAFAKAGPIVYSKHKSSAIDSRL